MALAGRFEIRRRLGEGGMGVVYEAFDTKRQAAVALKTLTHVDAAGIYRLKAEFRSLASVVHPNLVRLHDLVADGEQFFFTMDLVSGRPFLEHIRSDSAVAVAATLPADSAPRGGEPIATQSGGRFQEQSLRDALRQLAEGVSAIHAEGKLHRDLKPHNVLVTRDGGVVILDFGLVSSATDRPIGETAEDVIAGTPAYMAPEQVTARALPASDWYAVGVMLYEALTGEIPFTGPFQNFLLAKQSADPIPPGLRCEGIPDDLNALCVALLKRDPAERATGADILRAVGNFKLSLAPATSTEAPPFVGRAEELSEIQSAWEALRVGVPVVVLLSGPSGVGKTTLVQQFLAGRARTSSALALLGRCHEREFVPFKAFDGVIDELGRHLRKLPRERAAELLPRDIHALARVFPTLRRVDAVANATTRDARQLDDRELRRRAFGALKDLLCKLSDRDRVVIFVDDLQWGDEDSALLLEALTGAPEPPALLFVGCYRDDGEAADLVQRALALGKGRSDIQVKKIRVDPLSADEATQLAQQMLDPRSGSGAAALPAEIAREANGLPYFVAELVRFSQSRTAEDAAHRVASLPEVVAARAAALPEPAQRLLEVVALAGRGVAPDLIAQVAQVAHPHEAIETLLAAKLVRRTGPNQSGVIAFHDRVRETITATLDPDRARKVYAQLAAAIEAVGQPEAEWLCDLYQRAGLLQRAASQAILAGDLAADGLAFGRAVVHYRFALANAELLATERSALRRKLGDALESDGHGYEAAQMFIEAAEEAPSLERMNLRRKGAEQLIVSGHVDEGSRMMRGVLEAVGLTMPRTSAGALFLLLTYSIWLWIRGTRFKERGPDEVRPLDRARIDAWHSVSMSLVLVDAIFAQYASTRHLSLALGCGDRFHVLRALSMRAVGIASRGGLESRRERDLSNTVRDLAKRVSEVDARMYVDVTGAFCKFMHGRWKDLVATEDDLLAGLTHHRGGWRTQVQVTAIWALVLVGELDRARLTVGTLIPDAQDRGDIQTAVAMRVGYTNLVWLANDDPLEARREIQVAAKMWSHSRFFLQNWRILIAEVNIDLYEGNGPAAHERVVSHWRQIKRSLMFVVQYIRADAHYLRARVALASLCVASNRKKRLAEAIRFAKALDRERMPWTDMLAAIVWASIRQAHGDRSGAIGRLRSAIERADEVGMALHAATARYQLGMALGDSEGQQLVAAAEGWMRGQGIRAPERFAAMLVPGAWSVGAPQGHAG